MEPTTEEAPAHKRKREVQDPDQSSLKSQTQRTGGNRSTALEEVPGCSSVSMISEASEGDSADNSLKPGPSSQSGENGGTMKRVQLPGLRSQSVSMKDDRSMYDLVDFSPGPETPSQTQHFKEFSDQTQLDNIFTQLEKEILAFVRQRLQKFHSLLSSENISESDSQGSSEGEERSREAVLNLALHFLRGMGQEDLAQRLSKGSLGVCRDELKSCIKHKYSEVFEGVTKTGSPAPLRQIYTDLYIIQGRASEVNQEHEIRHMESMSRRPAECSIRCEDIFKQQSESDKQIRAVLTEGVAGVGKTVLTQKFSLDWAEGRANQDIQLVLPFTFRELNLLRDTEYSVVELLHHSFSQTKGLHCFGDIQLLFIFDGLDECRLPLDFSRTRVMTKPTERASVEELLVNLIRGKLLPCARLWITTRPAAAYQIPEECICMMTEVRGFTNPQKDLYFRKRFKQRATAVISHIKSTRSLYIMSSIPIFCWIISTVLQKILNQIQEEELPKTLTQMYIHFLVVQAKVKNIKFHGRSGADLHWTPETRQMVWSLGKLAFEQLMKGNLIFYQIDLTECGLDAAEIARYSGVFTEILREVRGLYKDKVYCFIHLTVQEFLAALYVHETFFGSGVNLLSPLGFSGSSDDFYRAAVALALKSPNGHLDLFLRFLFGLSLPANQRLLQGLLSRTDSDTTIPETVKCIHENLNAGVASADRRLNLLHCLNELNDRSLVQEIQKVMREGRLSDRCMSPAQWSAVSFLLLSSDSNLEEFDLRKYCPTEEALLGLLPVIKASIKVNLSCCGLTSLSCSHLASVLSSSNMTLLDLSNNDLQDSGMELLCEGLKSATCRLETLKLFGCMVTERGGALLASALSSSPSTLRELDLSYNHPGASADLLTALRAPHGPLLSLRLDPAGECWMVPGLRKYACKFSLDPNTVGKSLLLSDDLRSVACVKEEQQYPDHQDRFREYKQVLSSTGLRGRCYWEVDWRGGRALDIAVSYRGIQRSGRARDCWFGFNDQSWCLRTYEDDYYVQHNNILTRLTDRVGVASGRLGLFLDWEGGALSFYDVVSDRGLVHLHTFSASFSEPLYPGFGLRDPSDSVSLVNL